MAEWSGDSDLLLKLQLTTAVALAPSFSSGLQSALALCCRDPEVGAASVWARSAGADAVLWATWPPQAASVAPQSWPASGEAPAAAADGALFIPMDLAPDMACAAVVAGTETAHLARVSAALTHVAPVLKLRRETEVARAREDRLRNELQRSNEALEEFASLASHDLQEPVRKILAFGGRIQSHSGTSLDEKGRDYLNRIQESARRMQTLVDGLLEYSRVATRSTRPARVDLSQIARDVLGDLQSQLERTGGVVELGALPSIEADPTQMRQLMQNLMSNALKFHRHGTPPRLTVGARALPAAAPDAPSIWELQFKDNGIGFEPRHSEKIFGVLQRLHGRAAYEGTGLGLALCRRIVERHGGSIDAEGTPGLGATFTVKLPSHQPLTRE